MENKDLEWIADVIEKLQVPQVHNERERLTKILKRVAPALIRALDYTAVVGFTSYTKDDEVRRTGEMCNGCGQDHYYDKNNPKHKDLGVKRDGTDGEQCRIEELFQILEEEKKKEDK